MGSKSSTLIQSTTEILLQSTAEVPLQTDVRIINQQSGEWLYAMRGGGEGEDDQSGIGITGLDFDFRNFVWRFEKASASNDEFEEGNSSTEGTFRMRNTGSQRVLYAQQDKDDDDGVGASLVGKHPEYEDTFFAVVTCGDGVLIVNAYSKRCLFAHRDCRIGAQRFSSLDEILSGDMRSVDPRFIWKIVPNETAENTVNMATSPGLLMSEPMSLETPCKTSCVKALSQNLETTIEKCPSPLRRTSGAGRRPQLFSACGASDTESQVPLRRMYDRTQQSVLKIGVRRFHTKFVVDQEIDVTQLRQRPDDGPKRRIMCESFLQRLLSRSVELKACVQGDVAAAQRDLCHLSRSSSWPCARRHWTSRLSPKDTARTTAS